jgi:hypothetical protein
MRSKALSLALTLAALASGRALSGQETPTPSPTPTPTPAAEAPGQRTGWRPIESNVIVNVPSVDVPPAGTLTFLVTHRFEGRIQDGDINNFFTLDTGNTWGFGLWYAPLKNLNVGFSRSSDLNTYEASAQYAFPRVGGFGASLRLGEDWRTETGGAFVEAASPHSSFFAQAILAYSFGPYVRLTAVPTYLQRTNGIRLPFVVPLPGDQSCRLNPAPQPPNPQTFSCSGLYENIFNVPVAASVAITHSISVHGEVIPRLSKVNSNGVGWSVTVEKSLLRHRFAFFAGNQRATTVDKYTGAVPRGQASGDVYIGFNLYRAWKLR